VLTSSNVSVFFVVVNDTEVSPKLSASTHTWVWTYPVRLYSAELVATVNALSVNALNQRSLPCNPTVMFTPPTITSNNTSILTPESDQTGHQHSCHIVMGQGSSSYQLPGDGQGGQDTYRDCNILQWVPDEIMLLVVGGFGIETAACLGCTCRRFRDLWKMQWALGKQQWVIRGNRKKSMQKLCAALAMGVSHGSIWCGWDFTMPLKDLRQDDDHWDFYRAMIWAATENRLDVISFLQGMNIASVTDQLKGVDDGDPRKRKFVISLFKMPNYKVLDMCVALLPGDWSDQYRSCWNHI
jgi:hypothetical protein